MLSKLLRRARPGEACSRASVHQQAGEVIRGFVTALARCEAALARPPRRRGRRQGVTSFGSRTA